LKKESILIWRIFDLSVFISLVLILTSRIGYNHYLLETNYLEIMGVVLLFLVVLPLLFYRYLKFKKKLTIFYSVLIIFYSCNLFYHTYTKWQTVLKYPRPEITIKQTLPHTNLQILKSETDSLFQHIEKDSTISKLQNKGGEIYLQLNSLKNSLNIKMKSYGAGHIPRNLYDDVNLIKRSIIQYKQLPKSIAELNDSGFLKIDRIIEFEDQFDENSGVQISWEAYNFEHLPLVAVIYNLEHLEIQFASYENSLVKQIKRYR